jgi:ribokinase
VDKVNESSVFCYGEIGVDNIIQAKRLPTPEIAVFPKAESYHIGGAAANTAVWLAHLGIETGLSGNFIGNDKYGRDLVEWLSRHQDLDLRHLRIEPGLMTPFTRAIVTPDGERSFLIFYYPQTPKSELTNEMVHNTKYLALDLYGGDERIDAAEKAVKAGIKTVIGDVIWPDHRVLPLTSIATNSGSFIRSEFPGVDIQHHAHELQAVSKGIVITTDGAQEIYTVNADGSSFSVKPPQIDVVDATGAGDAFRAGLIFGLLKGFNLAKSVCLGAAAGSLKVKNYGAATILPDLVEVMTLAEKLNPQVNG